MIKPTPSAWSASQIQAVRAEAMMADSTKQLEAAGFCRVEGTPDVWEYRGSRDEAEAVIERVIGLDKVKNWWRPTKHNAYRPGTPLWDIVIDGWSRGFYPMQTLQEARAQGYVVSLEWIQAHWDRMTQQFRTTLEA